MTAFGHIASVVAIWTMMLFGLRFAVAAGHWLIPIAIAGWRLARCAGPDTRMCRRAFLLAIECLHFDLSRAITTPWSATLLFAGSVLVGLAFACGSAGDAAQLVAHRPEAWQAFDVVTDCIAAILGVTGMAFIQAATSHRRTASFLVSAALVLTGLGIGVLTL